MADNGVAEAALPVGGLVTNIVSVDGSLVISPYKGQIINLQARATVNAAANVTALRALGTPYVYMAGLRGRRTVYASIKLQANATTATATYATVIDGVPITAQFGLVGSTGSTGIAQSVSFLVDPGATYRIDAVLGAGGGAATVLSWVEVDSDHP